MNKTLRKVLIGGMLFGCIAAFGDSFMNDWSRDSGKVEDKKSVSYGYPINHFRHMTSQEGPFNGVIDGNDAVAFEHEGKLAFMCNTRSNNSVFCDSDGNIYHDQFMQYVNANYSNLILTDIPYKKLISRICSYDYRFFFRSFLTSKGERKIAILHYENHETKMYFLKIIDNRDKGDVQKALLMCDTFTSMNKGSAPTFFDIIDFRTMAINKDHFKKYDDLNQAYAVIGGIENNQRRDLMYLVSLERGDSFSNINAGVLKHLRAGMLGIDENGKFVYYISRFDSTPQEYEICKIGLALENRGLTFKGLERVRANHCYTDELNNLKCYDPLIRITTDSSNEVQLQLKKSKFSHDSPHTVAIGKMGSVVENTKDCPFKTSYKGNDTMSFAKKFAQTNGYNINLIIYGTPYMVIQGGTTTQIDKFPSIINGRSTSETTWNSWGIGGKVSIESGVTAGVSGVAGGSLGITSEMSHKHENKFSETQKVTMSVESAFLNEKHKQDWSVGSVYFTSTAAEYSGYCYLGSLAKKGQHDATHLILEGAENCPFSIIIPYIAMKPSSDALSYNFHSDKMDERIGTWETIGEDRAKKAAMLTAGIPNFEFGIGESNSIHAKGSRQILGTGKTINKIVDWQNNELNLDILFEAGNKNEKIQKNTGKFSKNFTGVVKGEGCDSNIVNIGEDKNPWGWKYSTTDNKTITVELKKTKSTSNETDLSFGFHSTCEVSVPGVVGGYSDISASINGSFANGKEGTKEKLFSVTTVGGIKTGNAGVAVADIDVAILKSWLMAEKKTSKRPGFISEYAWENNSKFTAVIPFVWKNCVQAQKQKIKKTNI